MDEWLRDAVIGQDHEINPELNMYVTHYPHAQVRVIRDLAFAVPTKEGLFFTYNCIKIWPLAILLSDYPFLKQEECNWKRYFSLKRGFNATVTFDKSVVNSVDWPEGDTAIPRLLGGYACKSIIGWPSVI
jgi:hypothetical protein